MSWERDDSDAFSGDASSGDSRQGGVIVVPAHEAPGLSMRDTDRDDPSEFSRGQASREQMRSGPRGARTKHVDGHLGMQELPKDRCVHERGRLAQRLLELRGIQIGPGEALLVIEESEQPLSGAVRRSLFGLESAGVGGTMLQSAVSYDSETRERLSRLVRCMGQ